MSTPNFDDLFDEVELDTLIVSGEDLLSVAQKNEFEELYCFLTERKNETWNAANLLKTIMSDHGFECSRGTENPHAADMYRRMARVCVIAGAGRAAIREKFPGIVLENDESELVKRRIMTLASKLAVNIHRDQLSKHPIDMKKMLHLGRFRAIVSKKAKVAMEEAKAEHEECKKADDNSGLTRAGKLVEEASLKRIAAEEFRDFAEEVMGKTDLEFLVKEMSARLSAKDPMKATSMMKWLQAHLAQIIGENEARLDANATRYEHDRDEKNEFVTAHQLSVSGMMDAILEVRESR